MNNYLSQHIYYYFQIFQLYLRYFTHYRQKTLQHGHFLPNYQTIYYFDRSFSSWSPRTCFTFWFPIWIPLQGSTLSSFYRWLHLPDLLHIEVCILMFEAKILMNISFGFSYNWSNLVVDFKIMDLPIWLEFALFMF